MAKNNDLDPDTIRMLAIINKIDPNRRVASITQEMEWVRAAIQRATSPIERHRWMKDLDRLEKKRKFWMSRRRFDPNK